jgi:putative mRNA 3-end processing factor
MNANIELTENGLYCRAGDFYIDPWRPVPSAVVTHAHADHLTWGCGRYLVSAEGERVTKARLWQDGDRVATAAYGETVSINGVRVSLHPAGHILGSAQVRIETPDGFVSVITGDYKTEADATCTPFELVRCHLFVTESTFGLPIYRWRPQAEIFADINAWWLANADEGKPSVLFGYALGKAQRLLAGLDASIGPILTHGAVERMTRAYRESGVPLPETRYAGATSRDDWKRAMIVAPPSARGSVWLRKFGNVGTGFASGWMQIRGARRQRSVDRGFALSDHVDWPSLLHVIEATGAETVYVTHGYTAVLARWLNEQGRSAFVVETLFSGEREDSPDNLAELPEENGEAP